MRLFLLGVCVGIAATLWIIGRSMGTPASVQEWQVPDTEYDGIGWRA